MSWTKMLRAKEIVKGRLIMVETKQKSYYRYVIFPLDKEDYSLSNRDKIIYSPYEYLSWKGAISAGKKHADTLLPVY